MAHVLDAGEKDTQRSRGQWAKTYLAIPAYHTIYTARLNGIPSSNDMIAEISVNTEAGTLAEVLPDMTLYIGSQPGAYDLGMCRIRKTPITGTFYIGETSEITWVNGSYLTVVDDYSLWQKSLRIDGSTVLMDWDIPYTDHHEDFDPAPAMGTHRVKKLAGPSVDVLLGPSADAPAWVFDSTITARAWTCAGATLDDSTAVNPIGTFTAAGTYLAYCAFTAANGKTFTAVRYIIIWDEANPLIKNFQIRNGRGNYDSGSYSFDLVLLSDYDEINIRKRSLIIICTEDYAEGRPVTMPGQIEGAENILCVGWVADFDNQRSRELKEVSFPVESAEYWLKQIRDYPSGLELKIGTAAAWTDMPSLSVDRAAWHFIHWRSTATRILDFQPTGDGRLASRFTTARANLWERLLQIGQPTIFASPHVDQFGRLFFEIEPQMIAEADRDWPIVLDVLDSDIEESISWVRRDVTPLSMLFFSGIHINTSGGASSFFSMAPGHSYGHHGDEESQDNYLVESQAGINAMCANYYGWRNNPLDDLEIRFTHSLRALGLFPRQRIHYAIDPADDPRGIGYDGNWIPREVQFNQDPDTGFIAFSFLFEPEAPSGPSINGDVPGMESIDFSGPDFPALRGLPSLPALPILSYPPSIDNPNQPRKVIVADSSVYQYGIFYTDKFNLSGSAVEWLSMNNGLTAFERATAANILVTPNGKIFLMASGNNSTGWDRLFVADGLGGSWRLLYQPPPGETIKGIGLNPNKQEEIGMMAGDNSGDNGKFFIGNSSGMTLKQAGMPARGVYHCGVAFSADKWFVFSLARYSFFGIFHQPIIIRFSATGSFEYEAHPLVMGFTGGDGPVDQYAIAAGTQDLLLHWSGSNILQGYGKHTLAGVVETPVYTIEPLGRLQGIAASPTGTHMMAAHGVTAIPYNTTDGGATWNNLGGVIPIGSDVWENCRADKNYIFGGGNVIRLTMDHGATYLEKIGNLLTIAALCDIAIIRFIE